MRPSLLICLSPPFEGQLKKEEVDYESACAKMRTVEYEAQKLFEIDEVMKAALFAEEIDEEDQVKEFEDMSDYRMDILKAWGRFWLTPTAADIGSQKTPDSMLTNLMDFLKAEVENDERIRLASDGFSAETKTSAKRSEAIPTAATILSVENSAKPRVFSCIFCGKSSHNSQDCGKALNMQLKARREIVVFTLLDSEDDESIARAKKALAASELYTQLHYIDSNFGALPDKIELLQRQNTSVFIEAVETVEEFGKEKWAGQMGKKAKDKLEAVLKRNPAWEDIRAIAARLRERMETNAVMLVLSQLLLVTFVKCQSWSSTERHPWGPEPEVQSQTPDPSSNLWRNKNDKANYTGLIYAPRLAFNWIVFLVVPEHQEGAIGNIISEKFILSNCRVAFFIKYEKGSYIAFATHFLFEDHLIRSQLNIYDVEGVRGVREVNKRNVTVNRQCSPSKIDWDVSILEVTVPIFPLVPYIGIMPIAVDYKNQKIRPWVFPDQSLPRFARTTCWVGTFGRKSFNNPQPLETDYFKVQYRVYSTPLTTCFESLKFLCSPNEPCSGLRLEQIEISKAKCFTTRAKVGSVCDQDRGAPLACDGEVFLHYKGLFGYERLEGSALGKSRNGGKI
ncbi:hypothetical protein GE061_013636 [Apolygus lucorum]|uniref:CCHC-type domain-containing protein n=1 Tax=Apolygus lucorum TaxID=248454 RepID=A0A8S9XNC4_APOLU|nr:hypothetical protein GE061_013636 [Apolygus lucorum]